MLKEKCNDCGKKIFYIEQVNEQKLVRCNKCHKIKYMVGGVNENDSKIN